MTSTGGKGETATAGSLGGPDGFDVGGAAGSGATDGTDANAGGGVAVGDAANDGQAGSGGYSGGGFDAGGAANDVQGASGGYSGGGFAAGGVANDGQAGSGARAGSALAWAGADDGQSGSSALGAAAGVGGEGGNGEIGGAPQADGGGGGVGGIDNGGVGNTAGAPSLAGAPGAQPVSCGLPELGTRDVPKPSGSPGQLTVLGWAGLRGAVTYTFDDANSSQILNYGVLQSLGVPMTFYLQTGKGSASDPIWAQAVQDGHELGNHTQSHSASASDFEVDTATEFIESTYGVKIWTMAAPYGNVSYMPFAETRFLINRGVSNALIGENDAFNPFNLPCYIPPDSAPASALNAQVDSAQAGKGWRVILVHGFKGGSDGAYNPIDIDEFVASVEHAKSLGDMWIDTMVNVASYWRGERAFQNAAVTADATGTTWTWTLPQNFPPGRCLRVSTEGGTLRQGERTLDWNDRGYYEISLDAGSVTLSE